MQYCYGVIPLTKGEYTIVDIDDLNTLSKYRWYYTGKGYAARRFSVAEGIGIQLMHRQIMGNPYGLTIDHKNQDKLDNQRSNLRLATDAQNKMNSVKPINNTSGYKGVTWNKRAKKYIAQISHNNKQIYLGHFPDLISAAIAYNDAATELRGDFASLNEV